MKRLSFLVALLCAVSTTAGCLGNCDAIYMPTARFSFAHPIDLSFFNATMESEEWWLSHMPFSANKRMGATEYVTVRAMAHRDGTEVTFNYVIRDENYRGFNATDARRLLEPEIAAILAAFEPEIGPARYIEYVAGVECAEDWRQIVRSDR